MVSAVSYPLFRTVWLHLRETTTLLQINNTQIESTPSLCSSKIEGLTFPYVSKEVEVAIDTSRGEGRYVDYANL